jgi:diguanylate cyclase (GGDEF)-like protein
MRLRSVAPWILLPPLLGVVLCAWFADRSVSEERARLGNLGRLAVSESTITDAQAWVASEISSLAALDAFAYDHPGLGVWASSAEVTAEALTREQLYQQLRYSEDEGERVLTRLRAVDGVPADVETVLRPIDDDVLGRVVAGDRPIDPAPYAAAIGWLNDQYLDAGTRSADAATALVAAADEPPYWRRSDALAITAASLLLAVAGGCVGLLHLRATWQRSGERLALAEARGQQMGQIITAARRLSAQSDFPSLARALMAETRALLGGDLATLALRDGARLAPVAATGDIPTTAITTGDGTIGRCVETGWASRVVVPGDPFFPGVSGPVSVLAAPLVADGHVIGAIVVASRSADMFDDEAEATLQLLALVAAGAVTAAQRYDSTVALALHDPLTGLANRRRLDHDLATAAVTEAEVAFLMVDIDHFKAYNDRHGHQRGDELLQTVASAISAAVRERDVVYRYGGEEFSVLLPGADTTTATGVAERVRTAVVGATAGLAETVTVSVGVATGTAPIEPADLVARADRALYEAKQDGRDRIALAR